MTQKLELARSKHRHLLDDPDFKRWYNNIGRKSISTSQEWVRRFGLIYVKFSKLPADIAKMDSKTAGNFLLEIVDNLESEGKSGSYVSNCVKPVKNWLAFNDVYVHKKINISNRHRLTKFADERVPTQDELRLVIGASDFRSKTMCALMAFGGIRPEVLGNSIGADGLRLRDFQEMKIHNKTKTVEFTRIPSLIVIRPELSKTSNQYSTFLPLEGTEYVKRYLESRMAAGESLDPDTSVITQKKFSARNSSKGFMRTSNLSEYVKIPIVKAGFSWRPYVLRRYFATRMMLAESDGIILNDWRVFWMGHKGSMEATYTVNKQLSPDAIEKMRESYAKAADKYLVTVRVNDVTADRIKAEFNRNFLEMAGLSEDEITKLGDLSQVEAEDLKRLMKDNSKKELGLNGNSQKVVPLAEVEKWIVAGWEYVKDLPQKKAIIRLPNGS